MSIDLLNIPQLLFTLKERPDDPGGRGMDGWTYYGGVASFHRSDFGLRTHRQLVPVGDLPLLHWGHVRLRACWLSLCLVSSISSRESRALYRHTAIWTTSMVVFRVFSHRCRNKGETMPWIIVLLNSKYGNWKITLPHCILSNKTCRSYNLTWQSLHIFLLLLVPSPD